MAESPEEPIEDLPLDVGELDALPDVYGRRRGGGHRRASTRRRRPEGLEGVCSGPLGRSCGAEPMRASKREDGGGVGVFGWAECGEMKKQGLRSYSHGWCLSKSIFCFFFFF